MPTSNIIYSGNLRTECTHIQSGQQIITDAPVDNHGRGEAFSPTDLMATSLASCMITVMGIAAQNHKFIFADATASLTKVMASGPRRVSAIQIVMSIPDPGYTDSQKKILETAARGCPVAESIHPDIKLDLAFRYPEAPAGSH